MGRKKLSVRTGEELTPGWFGYNDFDDSQIKDIKIIDSRSDKSLNAIPSPLARMHLLDAAFNLAYQDESQETNYSGYAYKKLVSDCFDVFELIYNWNYHKQDGKQLSILVWNKAEEINKLKKVFETELKRIQDRPKNINDSNNQINFQNIQGFKTYLVGKTLDLYLNQSDFTNIKEFHILKYNKVVIAGTSPFTGFFTTPNDLSTLDLINPFSRKKYFDENPRTFADRDEKIKKFIWEFFNKKNDNGERIFDNQLSIIDYLKFNKKAISDSLILNLEPIAPEIKIFNKAVTIETSKDRNDYLENYLIKVNYRINDLCFYTASNLNPTRTYDYLLPLSPAFFSDFINSKEGFNAKNISSIVTVSEKGDAIVEVSIKNKNGKLISKTYKINKSHPLDGEIVNLTDNLKLNLSLSLFPNVMVENRPELNNYFKVMLGLGKINSQWSNDDVELNFFTNDRKIGSTEPHLNCTRVNRTDLSENISGSSYFEINGKFDFIQVSINSEYFGGNKICCSIIPKWQQKKIGTNKFRCAIDFGTSTSFVGIRNLGNLQSPVALSIEKPNELLVAHFHQPKQVITTNIEQSPFDYESFESFNTFTDLEIKEFLPVIIGSDINSKFRFPLRTAICEVNNSSLSLSPLSNANIAFGYEKITLNDKHQSFKTNLKWSVEGTTENRIRAFLNELGKIIKYKIILNNGDPSFTDIVWFYPLSFGTRNLELFQKIWQHIYNTEFKGNGKLIRLSESEAPFYFHKVNAKINNFNTVLSIDIGGGSTDIVFFENGLPKIGSSFNYATNLLWSDGNIRVSNSRENGIYNYYKQQIVNFLRDKSSTETNRRRQNEYQSFNLLNEVLLNDLSYGSDDIINFWLSNDDKTHFTHSLERSQYRLNFLFFFSAIIYHSAQLLKAKGIDKRPACICISGNGSKVIDLITNDENKLSKICQFLINKAFEIPDNNYFPQIILPLIERKEATCYGGLYKDDNSGAPEKFTYLGVLSSDAESFKNVEHYKEITSSFENSVNANVRKFIGVFKKMNGHINFKNELGLDVPLDAMENFMIQGINRNYQYEKDKKTSEIKPDETINDSPFFWSLKGLLFDLSVLDATKLDIYRNKIDFFFERPTLDGEFSLDKASRSQLDTSLYKIEIEDDSSTKGRIYLLTETEYSLKTALSNIEANLLPVCSYNMLPNPDTSSIRVNNYGEVEKINNSWVIGKKIDIQFI